MMKLHLTTWLTGMLVVLATTFSMPVQAEPYLAVRTGAQCSACHVNPTGGGMRNPAGTIIGNSMLPANKLESPGAVGSPPWDGRITDYLSVGADLRASLRSTTTPTSGRLTAFSTERASVYIDLRLIPDRLSLYIDERVAPGIAFTREAYLLLRSADSGAYLKAGRLFLPYGLRLEDDRTFIRQVSGINFNSSDDGVEGGWAKGPWSVHLALSNGSSGGTETNNGKQLSLLANLVYPLWRAGASYNVNSASGADRKMGNLFGGLRTGPISWLGEIDYFVDDGTATGRRKSVASLLEANTEVAKGHNLKLGYEFFDPDRTVAQNQRTRYSLAWEYTPFQGLQLRTGYRHNRGIPQSSPQNSKELFLQLHGYL